MDHWSLKFFIKIKTNALFYSLLWQKNLIRGPQHKSVTKCSNSLDTNFNLNLVLYYFNHNAYKPKSIHTTTKYDNYNTTQKVLK